MIFIKPCIIIDCNAKNPLNFDADFVSRLGVLLQYIIGDCWPWRRYKLYWGPSSFVTPCKERSGTRRAVFFCWVLNVGKIKSTILVFFSLIVTRSLLLPLLVTSVSFMIFIFPSPITSLHSLGLVSTTPVIFVAYALLLPCVAQY